MSRLINISTIGLAAIMTLHAGQIQIGSGSNGLTSSYVASGTTTSCSGNSNTASTSATGWNGCAVVTQGSGIVSRNYVSTLFEGATGAVNPTGTTVTGSTITSATVVDTLNGNVTFNRIQGENATGQGVTADYWATSTAKDSSIVIPVGVYGVDKAWTLLNDYWGGNGEVGNISVTFTWANTSNGTGIGAGAYTQTIDLKNGETVRSAVSCTVSPTPAACKTNNGAMPISTTLDSLVAHGAVTANNVYNDASGNSLGAAVGSLGVGNRYVSQSGLIFNLDDQMFDFGSAHLTEFLVSITVRDLITSGYTGSTNSLNNSRVALSAITVNQYDAQATPEPSTVLMALAGLGALGYFRRRKV